MSELDDTSLRTMKKSTDEKDHRWKWFSMKNINDEKKKPMN